MSFVPLALASIFLALGLPVVLANFDSITFSPVTQCGNFTVLFTGGKPPAALPLHLTVVPFNATPISIGIADSDWDNATLTGAAITFLPLSAGTEFIASLDDADGNSAATVSDVIKISPANDSSCLPAPSFKSTQRYTVQQPVSQCQNFAVTYDPSVVTAPPIIRAFVPRNTSFAVNQSGTIDPAGQTSYVMDAFRGQQVVLLLNDTAGVQETAGPFTVGGDSSSSSACLPSTFAPLTNQAHKSQSHNKSHDSGNNGSSSKAALSKTAIIAIAVSSGCLVGGIAIAMVFWFCSERRRIRKKKLQSFEDSFSIVNEPLPDVEKPRSLVDEPPASPEISPTTPSRYTQTSVYSFPPPIPLPKTPPRPPPIQTQPLRNSEGFVKDPLYTQANLDLMSPASHQFNNSNNSRSLTADLTGQASLSAIPIPLSSLKADRPLSSTTVAPADTSRSRLDSMSSDDIEHILDMATMYSEPVTPTSTLRSSSARDSMSRGLITRPAGGSSRDPSLASPRVPGYVLRPSPAATPVLSAPVSGLLTPDSASLRRGPPQAPMPSSPSPTVSRFYRRSESSAI